MGIKSAGEWAQQQLKRMLSKPDYDYLIKGTRPKPKKTSLMRSNTGISTYRKAG